MKLVHCKTDTTLYQADCKSLKQLLRQAIDDGANLRGANLGGATYGHGVTITQPPLHVLHGEYDVLIMDNHAKIGCKVRTLKQWWDATDDHIASMAGDSVAASNDEADLPPSVKLWRQYKQAIFALAEASGRWTPPTTDAQS